MIKKRLEYEVIPSEEEHRFAYEPSNEDILELIEIAKSNLDSQVIVHWWVKYNGWYSRRIDATDTLETVKEKMPKSYGL